MTATSNTLQTLVGHILIMAQGLFLAPIIIKTQGPQVYGEYMLLISYLGIMFGLSSMGLGVSAKRWLPGRAAALDREEIFLPQFWFQVLSSLALGVGSAVAYACLLHMGVLQFSPFAPWLIPAYLVAHTVFSQGADYFRNTHRLTVFNVSTVIQPYLFISLALGIYYYTGLLTIESLLSSLVTATAIVGTLLMAKIFREIKLHFRVFQWRELLGEMRLGFPLTLGFLVDTLLVGGDRYIIAAMLSVRDAGTYAPAYALGGLIMVLPRTFGVVLPPLISHRIDAGDIAGAKRLSETAARVFLAVALPYIAGAAILGKDILALYTSPGVAQSAWPVTPLIAIASTFCGLVLIKANVAFVRLRTGLLFRINSASLVLSLLLNVGLLTLLPDVAMAALAALVGYVASYMWLANALADESASFTVDWRWLLRITLATGCMLAVLVCARDGLANSNAAALAAEVLGGIVVYTLLMFAQRPVRVEIMQFIRAVRRA